MPGENGFVKIDEGAKENGLAQMLGDLISQNLERVPAKKGVAEKMNGSVYINASDIGVAVTIEFRGRDGIYIFDGKQGRPLLEVEADSITVVDMSRLTFVGGLLPNFFDDVGRSIVIKMLKRHLKVKGMIIHLPFTVKLLNVFSVM